MTGKFWCKFGPVCGTESFRVTPSPPRSIPSPALEKIELSRRSLPAPAVASTSTPIPVLNAIELPAPAAPPIVLFDEPPPIWTADSVAQRRWNRGCRCRSGFLRSPAPLVPAKSPTPAPVLPEMMLPSPAAVPPIKTPTVPLRNTPYDAVSERARPDVVGSDHVPLHHDSCRGRHLESTRRTETFAEITLPAPWRRAADRDAGRIIHRDARPRNCPGALSSGLVDPDVVAFDRGVCRVALHVDAVGRVAGNDVSGERRRAADRRSRTAREHDAGDEVADCGRPVDVGPDQVSRDEGAGRAQVRNEDAVDVSRDEVARSTNRPADRVSGRTNDIDPGPVVAERDFSGYVGADEVPFNRVARSGGLGDIHARDVIARDQVAGAGAVPPIVLPADEIETPAPALGSAAIPAASVPIRFPSTRLNGA